MTERLLQSEWTAKVYELLKQRNLFGLIAPSEVENWWYRQNQNNLRLTELGFSTFLLAEIEFHHFKLPPDTRLVGKTMLGLSRMPVPYYLAQSKNGLAHHFYIASKSQALYMRMVDNDINQFVLQFLSESPNC